MLATSATNSSEPAVRMQVCVQVCGDRDTGRRVVWINPAAISFFAEYQSVQDGETGPRWTSVYLTNNHRLTIDASPEQFAGWLRGDSSSDGARWADLQSETEAIDGDQVV